MAIHQTQKQSDLEKRLKLLRQQVYGKENRQSSAISPLRREASYQLSDKTKKSDGRYQPKVSGLTTNSYSEITYLRGDLTKIALFASLAFGFQIILFYLLQNHILKINLF